jgi:hypothetical protein
MNKKAPRNVNGAECPDCGSHRTYCQATGYTDEGYRLRRRKCIDCDAPSFLTAEVVIPGAAWGELDSDAHQRARESYYRNRKSTKPLYFKPGLRKRPAFLDVEVKVIRPWRKAA